MAAQPLSAVPAGRSSAETGAARRRARQGWLLSTPALLLLLLAAAGPLLVVVLFSFLSQGRYGGVALPFTGEAWFRVFWEREGFGSPRSFPPRPVGARTHVMTRLSKAL